MNLYIIRHAIAVDEGTPEYEQDSERPLTDKGKKKMRQISKYSANSIALVGHEPQLTALVSLLAAENTSVDMTLKKGGVCRLSADDLHHSRKATLEWLLTPGILVEIGEK